MSGEEGANMDKKSGSRTSSVPPKGNGNDSNSKKNDNGTQRQHQRFSKKRETNGRSYSYDQGARRPTPQKNKVAEDKRPRSRGSFRPRDDMTDSFGDSYDAVYTGRKVNLNHLLNFTYDQPASYNERTERYGGGGHRKWHSRSVHYNKEQFLQANCQFIVKEKGDYAVHTHSPDILVDWDKVELIKVYSHELSQCPICLQNPVAAKMTRCGHIYCWACILHYLALGEKDWRKCPICYESLVAKDLKSVIGQEVHHYKTGETITMRLMRREKGTVFPVHSNGKEKQGNTFCRMSDDEKKTNFMKILLASKEDIQKHVLIPERQALELQLKSAEPSELPFIEGALRTLKEREEVNEKVEEKFLNDKGSTGKVKEKESNESLKDVPVENVASVTRTNGSPKNVKSYKSAFDDEEEDMTKFEEERNQSPKIEESIQEEGNVTNKAVNKEASIEVPGPEAAAYIDVGLVCGSPENPSQNPPSRIVSDAMHVEEAALHLEMPTLPELPSSSKLNVNNDNAYYFYQAEDGQHIYLHALNARCLVKEYGTLHMCPDQITATIVEMENVFMTEDLRKRLRYLNHLPLTCEFQVAELTLKPPVISKETLKVMADDIDKRRRLRQRRQRDERRWNKKAQEAERKTLGMCPSGTKIVRSSFMSGIESENRPDSPSAKSDDSVTSSLASPTVGSPAVLSSLLENNTQEEGEQTTNVSFAQMLKLGKTKQQDTQVWPKGKSSDGEVKGSSSGRNRNASRGSDDSDSEDKVPVPLYQNSFGSAIDMALENLNKTPNKDETSSATSQPVSGGKKKKKQQKLLLFSTSMARGGK